MMNSLIYLDSNVLVYAFCEQPDAEKKQDKSVELINNLLENGNLCLSNLAICEFAYILKRLKEDDEKIKTSIEILEGFIDVPDSSVTQRVLEIIKSEDLYKNSFDCYHLAFAETMNCSELITFDNDFNKFNSISKININILKTEI